MAAARPTVSVWSPESDDAPVSTLPLPDVFTAPIRTDVVQFVSTCLAKNKRQPYAVSRKAGHQTSAESWGTGRAVARIPRVGGGGTGRCGQGAFGNMCRSGRMFGPTKVWRKWHKNVNVNQKRYAVVSALAATAVPALVMARGHAIAEVPEVPLVLDDAVTATAKAADAAEILSKFGADDDVDRCKESKKIRRGKGKMRNRRYTMRRGPLIIYDDKDTIEQAFRNLPGVELCHVERLNLLQLAPGGHVGRFCIWTKGAFAKLDAVFGTATEASTMKKGFRMPRNVMANADLARLINSDEIQSVVRPAKSGINKVARKKNPLKHKGAMLKLNPYALAARKAEAEHQARNKAAREATKEARRANKAGRKAFYEKMVAEGDVIF
uniref:Large ribosomal subunit protein uL4 C-terminal domain-containing protein n=1 Tax=Phaeomonas parva TaxID=124430 RepID=A0A7S1TY71_9STRA|mmetsp:Transcript_2253/g.6772  ORF Transcript_2253/g.6772 Transcript_2253/m.6772 type:complete len:381 (+) Transcript_2253:65-1207(+)